MTEFATQLLEGGINCLHETFALWDAEDRMVLCNERFREVNKAVANLLPPGTSYQAFLRSGVEKGCFPEAVGGQGLPFTVGLAVNEMITSSNMAF
ncbi:MAG: hypothetical protein HOE05_19375, partial [Rhodospirillaceae bacterium]|nr:hypothetical protein [Rhodospirillaceae bacterium]